DCYYSQTKKISTFSNPLFDDSTSSDDESIHAEVIHEMSFKTYSKPLFDLDEEIISNDFNPIHNEDLDSTPKNDRFDTKSYLLESLLNCDTLMASSLKIDSLLDEFASKLIFLKLIPLGIDEVDCDPEEDIHLVERFLYDNSSPRPPKEFFSENFNADIESFSHSHIPVEDSNSFTEEIDLSFNPDNPMSPGMKEDDYDSERDILILEELLDNYSLSLPVIESYHFDIPSFSQPPAKPPDGNTGILNIKMMGDIFEQKYFRKLKDSYQMILSSKSSFPHIQLGIHLLHLAGSQPMLKSSYKAEGGVIISIPPLVGGVADAVVEIKGTGITEEIDLSFTPDDPMSPGIEDDDDDSERDILILEELLDNYSLSLLKMSHFVLICLRSLVLLQNHQMEKSPDLLSHWSLKAFQPSAKCLMMIHGKNIPMLDVPLFHFYPLDQFKYGGIGSSSAT
nr:hypothetical protein [Tanacetum cinerariifolium]